MAIKRYDVVAVTGSYTDRAGNEKRRFLNCGAVLETEKGLTLKLDALPTGSDGWFQLFEPRPVEKQMTQTAQPALAEEDDDLFANAPPF